MNSMEPEEELPVCEVVAAGWEEAGFTVLQLDATIQRTAMNTVVLNIFSTNEGTVKYLAQQI